MDEMRITPSPLCGEITLPPSKSYAHRAIICAALSGGVCDISPIIDSDDMRATIGVISALGAKCTITNDVLHIDATDIFKTDNISVDFLESGSTMRFLIPVIASAGISANCIGRGRLPERTIEVYTDLFKNHGACISNTHLPIDISGKLECGVYEIRGDISSQFITGLLLALPTLDGDSEIVLTTHLESKGYIDITLDCMKRFGVEIKQTENGYFIKGNQKYVPLNMNVESDWSQAAFFFCAGALCGDVTIKNLNLNSTQGDKKVLDVFKSFSALIEENENYIRIKKSSLSAIEIDVSNIPDMVPAIAVAAARACGVTKITGASRLRLKESDRIESVVNNLLSMGIKAEELPDGMIIHGGVPHGAKINCYNDHRIAMAFSILASVAQEESVLEGYSCVKKSYPAFFEDFVSLGGVADVIDR